MDAFNLLIVGKIIIAFVQEVHGGLMPILAMFQEISDYQGSSSEPVGLIITLVVLGHLAIIALFVVIARRDNKRSKEISRIMQTGAAAQARILEIWETGAAAGDSPEVGILLEVNSEETSIYRAEIKTIISILNIPRIQPGETVPVKFDREDPLKIVLAI